jgi:hypothetical protein
MSKIIYLTVQFHFENEMMVGTKDVYGYIIKNNKFISVYRDTLENDTNVFSEIRMMLSQETYKDEYSMDYNKELIEYLKNTNPEDVILRII